MRSENDLGIHACDVPDLDVDSLLTICDGWGLDNAHTVCMVGTIHKPRAKRLEEILY